MAAMKDDQPTTAPLRHQDPSFIKGLELSQLLFEEAVAPLLHKHMADISYSAGLLWHGSEVLGYDTPQSRDHDWGPRLQIFLPEAIAAETKRMLATILCQSLPDEIHGYSINMAYGVEGRVTMPGVKRHAVVLTAVDEFFEKALVWNPRKPLTAVDWVTFPQQHLRSIASGAVFHDGLGRLEPIRAKLSTYPHDIWLYLMAAQWQRISEEEPFMGRCGQVGDDLGSRWIASRLVHDIMRLCFLLERQYAPYVKWFGTAFADLACAGELSPILTEVIKADSWRERESHLSRAYSFVAQLHNALNVTAPLDTNVTPFYDRPFLVLQAGRFADALRAQITDPEVLALPSHLGGIDQWTDSTEVYNNLASLDRFAFAYG